MNGGKCKTIATFERLAVVAGDFDDNEDVWELVATAHVALEPLRGEERVAAQQINEQISHKVIWRYSAASIALDSGCRMLVGDRTFQIVSLLNVNERNHWIEAMVIERK